MRKKASRPAEYDVLPDMCCFLLWWQEGGNDKEDGEETETRYMKQATQNSCYMFSYKCTHVAEIRYTKQYLLLHGTWNKQIDSPVDFQPKMALPGDSLSELVIYTPK